MLSVTDARVQKKIYGHHASNHKQFEKRDAEFISLPDLGDSFCGNNRRDAVCDADF